MKGIVQLVGAGPGAPDLITLRGYRAVQAADVVLYDALIDREVLQETVARKIYVGKRCGKHALGQEEIEDLLVHYARTGQRVVRLKGGDPTVLGRGGEEALRLVREEIPFEIIPGVTSAVAAPSLAGMPVTHRGIADSFMVLTAHRRKDEAGFSIPPFSERTTLVFLMGLSTVEVWRSELLGKGYPPELPVALISDASLDRQQTVVTTLEAVVEAARSRRLTPPTTAVVGRVVSLRRELQPGAEGAPSLRPWLRADPAGL